MHSNKIANSQLIFLFKFKFETPRKIYIFLAVYLHRPMHLKAYCNSESVQNYTPFLVAVHELHYLVRGHCNMLLARYLSSDSNVSVGNWYSVDNHSERVPASWYLNTYIVQHTGLGGEHCISGLFVIFTLNAFKEEGSSLHLHTININYAVNLVRSYHTSKRNITF